MTVSGLEEFQKDENARFCLGLKRNGRAIGVYTITCEANGRVYGGSSSDCYQRACAHLYRLRKGRHHNLDLQRDFVAYGESAFKFTVVRSFSKVELARAFEARLVNQLLSSANPYNRVVHGALLPLDTRAIADGLVSVNLPTQVLARIRMFRRDGGLSRTKMAALAGIREGTIRAMDDPKWNPRLNTLRKLEALIPADYHPLFEKAAA